MSSWCPERVPLMKRRIAAIGAAGALASLGAAAEAAQNYFVPRVEATADSNSNLSLDPNQKLHSNGFGGSVLADIGIATPRSDTALRPEINYTRYPNRADISELDTRLTLRSEYRTLRSRLWASARFEKRDTTFAELPDATFNPLDPTLRGNPDTGR